MIATLRFENPEFLLFLLAIPLLIITHLYLFYFTRKKAVRFANFETIRRVTGKKLLTKNIGILALRLGILACLVLSLSQPVLWYEGRSHRSDFIIAIDTSASMTADDVDPNRFEAAKDAAIEIIQTLNATARMGVIGFSGVVRVEQTVTSDREAVIKAIESMEIQTVSGTDISQALITGTNLLLGSRYGRGIILLTDGSATVGADDIDPLERGVAYAKEHRVVVHAIGIGQLGSSPAGYLPTLYNVTAVYDEDSMRYVTNQTLGSFTTAADRQQLVGAYQEVLGKTSNSFQSFSFARGFLLLALFLLFIEWGLMNTRFRLIP